MSSLTDPVTTDAFDVVVVGSGAGGLAAAVRAAHDGASVLVLEAAEVCGGATAWSGGWLWAPRSMLAKAEGVDEPLEDVKAYLRAALGDDYDEARIDAFLRAAPEMIEFFHTRTPLTFVAGSQIKDVYGDLPHAGGGNRSAGAKPINARRLSKSVRRLLRRQLYETSFLGMGIMAGEDLGGFLAAARGDLKGLWHATWRVGLHLIDLLLHRRGMQLVNGCALIGRLLQAAENAGVQILTTSPAQRLLTDGDGRVTGVVARTPSGPRTFTARAGVVLAAGGFPHDIVRRSERFPRTPTGAEHWTLAPVTADGSGITLGESVGGVLTQGASAGAWCPVSLVPYRSGRVGVFPHIMDRAKPGSIGVIRTGRRFVNEANGYFDYVSAMFEAVPEGEAVQSWQIADAQFARRFPLGMAKPRPVPLFPYLRSGYLVRARTLRELAHKCGIDADGLVDEVARFNAEARRGIDSAFARGSTPFNRYGGDARNTPNPSLAPIEKPPFYAVRVRPGSFGTFAGLATDDHARVLDASGTPIAGLYAVGADQANVMGGHYPAGGVNIGPALTFGFIAGRDLAQTARGGHS
ncbi:FAD-dependent oxidoreductase [Microbacterium protaetiae]|uniref:FAD-dependent oxidoreductase n=1 Tax=Microbacterium protaetiae TaxID=2509458 RepID=A0A4P6EDY8_9MICO|nr:FAD-dependent oxidoreductase [Microbacterium protaetiae]QAY59289.1 FAD-dependent oxidoreductase [Microbacterium protaetiae]